MTRFEENTKLCLVNNNALVVDRNVPGFACELCWVRLSPLQLWWQLLCITLSMGPEKTEEIWSWLFFTTWFPWILNFIIKFNNAVNSTLAALDSNLVAYLGLRKYSPSFICTSAACSSRLSWWAVLGWRLKMYGSSWWISLLDNKRCDWFKTLKCENFDACEIWQAYKHSSRPLIFW